MIKEINNYLISVLNSGLVITFLFMGCLGFGLLIVEYIEKIFVKNEAKKKEEEHKIELYNIVNTVLDNISKFGYYKFDEKTTKYFDEVFTELTELEKYCETKKIEIHYPIITENKYKITITKL